MHFAKLRLAGFKSFVEPTELAIEPGLTGIVGPNGCGKSNLVDALSWAMGETSAKRMRGGEMDDVIFGGTSDRPARNFAEVTLLLENSKRDAPRPYDDCDEIEVVRRIERGEGSAYKVNGREVRARDVQLLFADAATGAQSPAIVSQGRIGAIIAAKPADRRAVLEEAAGITGLHARRHEAELRLKAAEANLLRLEDVLTTLNTQLDGLKKQARQASRYRRLSDHIRRAEAVVLHLKWRLAAAEREEAAERLRRAERDVADRTAEQRAAERAREEAAESLPTCAAPTPRRRRNCSASFTRAPRSRKKSAASRTPARRRRAASPRPPPTWRARRSLPTTRARRSRGSRPSAPSFWRRRRTRARPRLKQPRRLLRRRPRRRRSRASWRGSAEELAAAEARRAALATRREEAHERAERLASRVGIAPGRARASRSRKRSRRGASRKPRTTCARPKRTWQRRGLPRKRRSRNCAPPTRRKPWPARRSRRPRRAAPSCAPRRRRCPSCSPRQATSAIRRCSTASP